MKLLTLTEYFVVLRINFINSDKYFFTLVEHIGQCMTDFLCIAGRISSFLGEWKKLTKDPSILQSVKGYVIPFKVKPNSQGRMEEPKLSKEEMMPNGDMRFILNLKKLNQFIAPFHFKMEDRKTVVRLIEKDVYMATVDLKDSYFLVLVAQQCKKYLRHCFKGDLYEFNCIPFGVCLAPFVFTKLMKPIIECLRKRGWLSVIYLDYILLFGHTIDEIKENINQTQELLGRLGFILNKEKCELIPSKVIKFLGCIFDSENINFAEFIGVLVAASPAVKYGLVYTKRFEREKFLALEQATGNYDRFMVFSRELFADFEWGIHNIMEKKKEHINYLELKAAFYGLKCFAKNKFPSRILLRIDNTKAISYINRMGSVQLYKLSRLARTIWQWCEERDLWIFASYIKSKDNIEADAESRAIENEVEWELASLAFEEIESSFGPFDIDLFASNIIAKCRKFASWHKDPEACVVDSFTIPWASLHFYAFPPFSLILRTLRKILMEKAEGVVVVPLWATQPWYPLYNKLLATTSSSSVTIPDCQEIVRKTFMKKGILEKFIPIMLTSISAGTLRGYIARRERTKLARIDLLNKDQQEANIPINVEDLLLVGLKLLVEIWRSVVKAPIFEIIDGK
ncbi:uncharacterized protein [Prorops nasuta]|uniref:uncharacterized protein n=1 Tax=Prorops nasuta TaxID=863751 RepID=UPI0034CD625B